MDDLDFKILSLLQRDASITNQELAERVHASPPTCLRRVKRLVETGVIEKQVAILSPEACGQPLTAIVEITLDSQASDEIERFEQKMTTETAVTQCYRVSTGPDLILIVQLSDMQAYHALAHRVFTSANKVRNVRTFFATHRSKFETRIPLKPPRAQRGLSDDKR